MEVIDLEELARKLRWCEKHADKLVILNDVVVVIEETSRPKMDDIEKLESTIQSLKSGALKNYLRINPKRIIAIVHARRRDSVVPKILHRKVMKGVIYLKASCSNDVRSKIRKYSLISNE